MSSIVPIIVALLGGGAIAAIAGLIIAWRRESGSIKTTDADRLWTEREKFTKELYEELNRRRDAATLDLQDAERRAAAALKQAADDCTARIEELRKHIVGLELKLARQEEQQSVAVVASSVKKIEARVEESAEKLAAVAETVAKVETQVTTANGMTLAELGDATETRRVVEIPKPERTGKEAEHIENVPKDPT